MRLTAANTVLLAVAVVLAAALVYAYVGLPPKPPPNQPPPLPWDESVGTEVIEGDPSNINNDDIYYATPEDGRLAAGGMQGIQNPPARSAAI